MVPVLHAEQWCPRGDSNSHDFRRHPLKMVCLPIPPRGQWIQKLYVISDR